MAKEKNWARTSFAEPPSLTLQIGERSYAIAQFTASWAINQIPEAICMLAIGRDAYATEQSAPVHEHMDDFKPWTRASVKFRAEGEIAPGRPIWPEQETSIFQGYVNGFAYQKSNGKVQAVVHLINSLVRLGHVSSLTSVSHPSNPSDLTLPAIGGHMGEEAGGGDQVVFTSQLRAYRRLHDDIQAGDIGKALRSFFCGLLDEQEFVPPEAGTLEAHGITLQADPVATGDIKDVLADFEGAMGLCLEPFSTATAEENQAAQDLAIFVYGEPIKLRNAFAGAIEGMAKAIGLVQTANLAVSTIWDLLVSNYLPQLGIDLCPTVNRPQLVASCPAYRGPPWRVIRDYAMIDFNMPAPRLLRGVVVHGWTTMEAGAGFNEEAQGRMPSIAGVYQSADNWSRRTGALLYLPMPDWMGCVPYASPSAGQSTGVLKQEPTNTATTANQGVKPTGPTPQETVEDISRLCDRYAQMLYVQHNLRGRHASLIGKLRFDIAPGSHVKIEGSAEQFLGSEDQLASPLYGQVNRVTVEINAEDRRAVTAFALTHVRTEVENESDDYSVAEHPFYETGLTSGAPLAPHFDVS